MKHYADTWAVWLSEAEGLWVLDAVFVSRWDAHERFSEISADKTVKAFMVQQTLEMEMPL